MEGNRQTLMADFVVDASVVCGWVLPDENSPVVVAAFEKLQTANAIAPDILWHEVRNVLMMARRRKRIDFAAVREGIGLLRQLNIVTRPSPGDGVILDLAERHKLTAYDAAYFALAVEMKLPLATLDRQLIDAAAQDGVPLLA